MKKLTLVIITLGLILTSIGAVFAAQYTKYSSKFIKAFKDCDKYEENIVSDYGGETFTTNRKILGWQNGMCRYQETISSKTSKYGLNCIFGELQVEELTKAMKDRSKVVEKQEIDLFAEQKDPKTGKIKFVPANSQIIIGNKPFLVWTKYQNNPYFCIPHKL